MHHPVRLRVATNVASYLETRGLARLRLYPKYP
jgi:hypothetical protein